MVVALVGEGAGMLADVWSVTVVPLLEVAPDWVVGLLIVFAVVWVVRKL